MTESVVLHESRVSYLPAPIAATDTLDDVDRMRFKSPAVYKAWAAALARHLAPLLAEPELRVTPAKPVSDLPGRADAAEAGPANTRAPDETELERVENALEVQRRLSALQDLAILHTPPEARFTAIVRRARDLFGAEGAVFSLVTDTHQWNKARIGFPHTQIPIEQSFCATTIKSSGPFVVEDAWSDPRISFDSVVRFYAGCPVAAPDGTRIGALCVFDGNPRESSTIDTGFLEELAQDITDQLALPAPGAAIPVA